MLNDHKKKSVATHPLAGTRMTGSEMIVQILADQGVDMVFGYSGGAILPTFDALFRYNLEHSPESDDSPLQLVVPANEQDVQLALQIAADAGLPVLPRGGGTSQTGQTVGEALIIDTSKYLNTVLEFDADTRTVCVQPGLVLDQLNKFLKP